MRSILFVAGLFVLAACSKDPPPATTAQTTSAGETKPSEAKAAPVVADAPAAEVGKPAPDFTLQDLDGKPVHLASFKGKTVVLEWFNPSCPFVRNAHTTARGSLKDAPAKHVKEGVVWIAINSGGAGRDGAGTEASREATKKFGMAYPVLLDDTGVVGRKYGATNTPHMFVIDDKGTLVYRGAIDNSPDGEGESAPNNKLVSYVDEALVSLAAGKPLATAETKAYGCGVKYAH